MSRVEEYINTLENWIQILEKREKDAESWDNEKSVIYENGLPIPYCEIETEREIVCDGPIQPMGLCDACKYYHPEIIEESPKENWIRVKILCGKFNRQFEWKGNRGLHYSFV